MRDLKLILLDSIWKVYLFLKFNLHIYLQAIIVSNIMFTESEESKFCLTPSLLENKILKEADSGKTVKAFMYCNPNNPLGVVYPRDLTISLMEVCKKHKVHFISDEIYALSVFDPATTFDSALSIPRKEVSPQYSLLNA